MAASADDDRLQPVTRSAASVLDSPVRRTIVDLLANLPAAVGGQLPGLTAAELAGRLELHVTTVRFHVDQLVQAGLLETEFRSGRVGRPRKVYIFRPGAMASGDLTEAYAALSQVLAEAWPADGKSEPVSPEEAGRRWVHRHSDPLDRVPPPATTPGAWLGKVGQTLDLLSQWGYTPELRTTDGGRVAEIMLVDCPFLSIASGRPDVVCGVHRGLLRGAMERVGEPGTEVAVQPFVSPRSCVARIRQSATPEPSSETSLEDPRGDDR